MVLSSLRAADPYLLSNCYCSNTDWAEHINLFPFHPHICCAVCFFPLCPPIIAYQDVLGTHYRLRAHVRNLFYAASMCTFHHAPTQWYRWYRRKHWEERIIRLLMPSNDGVMFGFAFSRNNYVDGTNSCGSAGSCLASLSIKRFRSALSKLSGTFADVWQSFLSRTFCCTLLPIYSLQSVRCPVDRVRFHKSFHAHQFRPVLH